MSLDVTLTAVRRTNVYDANITHNLDEMAEAAGIYMHLWRPDEIGVKTAQELIEPLRAGLARMKAAPEEFARFNAANGWGTFSQFVPWIEAYLKACEENPDAEIEVSR